MANESYDPYVRQAERVAEDQKFAAAKKWADKKLAEQRKSGKR